MSSDRLLATRSIALQHSQHHYLHQSLVIHPTDVPEQLQIPLLYHVNYRAISVHTISDNAVAHFVFPAHCEYPPHLISNVRIFLESATCIVHVSAA